jgi:hypothetical protein
MFLDETLEEPVRLQEEFAGVQAYLHEHDPDLRLRRSVERGDMWVLERRCRRAPAVNTGMTCLSDLHVQARDGYIHVSAVHREWLMHPWNIIIALREEGFDTWAYTHWEDVVDEMEYEERWQLESRRRRRRDDYRGHLRESFDILSRMGNRDGTEATRFRNVGGAERRNIAPQPAA